MRVLPRTICAEQNCHRLSCLYIIFVVGAAAAQYQKCFQDERAENAEILRED